MKKLIKEYQDKIDGFDAMIETINNHLSLIRQGEYSMTSKDDLLDQRAIANIQRQIYVQVIADIESV